MSLDLLKEFGSPDLNPSCGIVSQSLANKAPVEEDDFGDFEDPDNEENVINARSSSPPSSAVRYPATSEWNVTQMSSMEVQNAPSNDDDWGDFSQHSVIFDADVEAARQKKEADRTLVDPCRHGEPTNMVFHPTTATQAFTPACSIPNIIGANGNEGSQELTKSRHHSLEDDSKRRVEATKATNLEQPTIDDEPWTDFEAVEAAKPGPKPPKGPPSLTRKVAEAPNPGPPPSNIPPPSILLPVVTTILGSLVTDLKKVTSHQPLDPRSTLSQFRASLSTTRAAARILAGRKLRWKRDNLLSQSMKIGPAHSGKAGGMKLAGVDKAESRREDQEAAEALQVWKQQVGPLRSMVAALNSQLRENERFRISEIEEDMLVRQGKSSEGMVTAPKCCFLCGIKRDERVAKVDVDVEDSFGEWWAEHWGHVDCVGFWEKYKNLLRQR